MFPPISVTGRAALSETIDRLSSIATAGFSVTMGAGGTSRDGTRETASAIAKQSGRPVTAHLIALGHSRTQALETAERFWSDGITKILALRGDPPRLADSAGKDSFSHASDVVAALRKRRNFEISVAAYPEKHPEAASLEEDIDHLKEKLDAGASKAICQFALDPEAYARFLDACARRGVNAPILPGVMPLENWTRVKAFAKANGTRVPQELDCTLGDLSGQALRQAAMEAVVEQAQKLVAYGAPALHVYALNRWELSLELAKVLGCGQAHQRSRP